jgi:hypothetical protein
MVALSRGGITRRRTRRATLVVMNGPPMTSPGSPPGAHASEGPHEDEATQPATADSISGGGVDDLAVVVTADTRDEALKRAQYVAKAMKFSSELATQQVRESAWRGALWQCALTRNDAFCTTAQGKLCQVQARPGHVGAREWRAQGQGQADRHVRGPGTPCGEGDGSWAVSSGALVREHMEMMRTTMVRMQQQMSEGLSKAMARCADLEQQLARERMGRLQDRSLAFTALADAQAAPSPPVAAAVDAVATQEQPADEAAVATEDETTAAAAHDEENAAVAAPEEEQAAVAARESVDVDQDNASVDVDDSQEEVVVVSVVAVDADVSQATADEEPTEW